jgi:RNA polymerase primary sigma factor
MSRVGTLEIGELEEDAEVSVSSDSRSRADDARSDIDLLKLFLAEIRRYPLLTQEEELELARRIEQGDGAARDRMIVANLRLVVAFARRYERREGPLLDAIQEGTVGLIQAVERYDWRRGLRFSTYASWWIRQAIRRGRTGTIRLPLQVLDEEQRLRRAERHLEQRLRRRPTDAELARACGLPVRAVDRVRSAPSVVLSLDRPTDADGEGSLLSLLTVETDVHEETAAAFEHEELHRALASLPERTRRILVLRYGLAGQEPRSLDEIGRSLGLSGQRIHQIERSALERLASVPRLAAGRLSKGLRALDLGALAAALRTAIPQKAQANLAASVAVVAAGATVAALPEHPGGFPYGEGANRPTLVAPTNAESADRDPGPLASAGPQSPVPASFSPGGAVAGRPDRPAESEPAPAAAGAKPAPGDPQPAAGPVPGEPEQPSAAGGPEEEPTSGPGTAEPALPGTKPDEEPQVEEGTTPGQSGATPGHGGTPPGHGGTPPGQSDTPPGQSGTPPGHGGTPPGQDGTPPGQSGAAPGQSGSAPGPAGTPPGQGGAPPGQGGTPPGLGQAPPGESAAAGGTTGPIQPGASHPAVAGSAPGHGGTPPGESGEPAKPAAG